MAVHLSVRRIPSILMLALLGSAVVVGTAQFLSRAELETAPASQTPASQVMAAVPLAPTLAETSPAEHPPAAEAEAEGPPEPEPKTGAQPEPAAQPGPEPELKAAAEAAHSAAARPLARPPAVARRRETLPVAAPVAAPEAASAAPPAAPAVPPVAPEAAPVAAPAAPQAVPVAAPVVLPKAPPAVTAPGRITVARLAVEPRGSPEPRDLAVSTIRPENMAPIPRRAPRAAKTGSIAAHRAATLFKRGAEIKIRKDANLYITARNIPDNDRLLAAYNADRPNGGWVQTRFGEAAAVPGLLGIAAQAGRTQLQRSQMGGQGNPVYSLADAMRDAIWRRNTAARLKSLTTAQNACVEGTAKRAPSIGLGTGC